MLKNINFGKGIIEYNNFKIRNDMQLENQVWELNEDLLQVKYIDKRNDVYILDVGWYPEFDLNGSFRIGLIKNYDWHIPVFLRKCDINNFVDVITKCIDYMNKFNL